MLNVILSYILSFAMMAGMAAVPAVPETINSLSVENVVIRVADESFELDSRAVLSAAVGTEESLLGFYLENNGSKLFPISAKITPEAGMFSISDVGSAFRVTDEALLEMIGLTEADMAQITEAIESGVASGKLNDMSYEEYMANGEITWDFMLGYEGAEVIESNTNVNGVDYPGKTVIVEDGVNASWALLDHLAQGDYGATSQSLSEMLAEFSRELEIEAESFSELFSGVSEEIPPMCLELTRADVQGDIMYTGIISMEDDIGALELVSVSYRNQESLILNSLFEEDDYTTEIALTAEIMNRFGDEPFSIEAEASLTGIEEVVSVGSDRLTIDFGLNFREEGKGCAAEASIEYKNDFAALGEGFEPVFSGSADADLLITEANGDYNIEANFRTNLDDEIVDLGLAFDICFGEAPYADPFEGKKIVDFSTPDELAESGEFVSDGIAISMDAMRIGFSKDARSIGKIAKLIEEIGA